MCLDRDHGDTEPYPNIQTHEWYEVGKAHVLYLEPGGFRSLLIRDLAREADVIYTCGFYDDYGYRTLILNRRNRLFGKPVIVASMGTFSKGALQQKALKKRAFIGLCKGLGLFDNITWSVTSELERQDVQRCIGQDARCVIAEDLPRSNVPGRVRQFDQERLNLAFLSRITPQKNLLGVIACLDNFRGRCHVTIYGPVEDTSYWNECRLALETLPSNVTWSYEGDVPSERVQECLQHHDVFILPTLGENYGHVIFEALSVGCLPVISDRTPWADVASRGAGFVLPLSESMSDFTEALERLLSMSRDQKDQMARAAVALAREKVKASRAHTGYRTLFDGTVGHGGGA